MDDAKICNRCGAYYNKNDVDRLFDGKPFYTIGLCEKCSDGLEELIRCVKVKGGNNNE